nr:PREDICTED: F-box only protein 28-like [Equus przewalskii]
MGFKNLLFWEAGGTGRLHEERSWGSGVSEPQRLPPNSPAPPPPDPGVQAPAPPPSAPGVPSCLLSS